MTHPQHKSPGPFDSGDPESGLTGRARELLADRRAVAMIGVALVAIAALCAFVVVPALTGSSSSTQAGLVPTHHSIAPATTSSASASATPSDLPTANDVLKLRDPFSPLYVVPAGATGATAGTSSSATVAPTVAPATTVAPTSVASTPADTNVMLTQLTLVRINMTGSTPTTADATVNGLSYHVAAGQKFATGFAMTSLTAGNAKFTYNGKTASLVTGQFALFATAS
jgi:PPE-repeat protein